MHRGTELKRPATVYEQYVKDLTEKARHYTILHGMPENLRE
jgi:hypothetical protein